jgi:uncharacterized iron-regulated protein
VRGNLTNLEEEQASKVEFVLKIGQDKKVLTIEMVMKKSQKIVERSVEGKGKSFINLLVQRVSWKNKHLNKELFRGCYCHKEG